MATATLTEVMDQEVSSREAFEIAREIFVDEIQRSIMMVEAAGSLRTLERYGYFESPLSSIRTLALLEDITPASRGGSAAGLEAEVDWKQMIDDLRHEYGPACLGNLRKVFHEIVAEIDRARAEGETEED